jgi:hypothetical protein
MKRLRQLVVVAGTASALTYFFDSQNGRDRRSALRDRFASIVRGRKLPRPTVGEKLDEIDRQADLGA